MRNRLIFQDANPNMHICIMKSLGMYKDLFVERVPKKKRVPMGPFRSEGKSIGFYDGVSQGGVGRCGVLLKINEQH